MRRVPEVTVSNPEAEVESGAVRLRGRPQFSLAHLTVLGCAPPEATYMAARAGYDFVSFRTILMGLPHEPDYALARNPAMLRETKAALAGTGIKALDIELARIADAVDVKTYVPAMEAAAELGIRNVISSIWTPDRNHALEALTELCDLAAAIGMTINLEFVTWASVANLQDAAGVIRAVNRPNCGLMIDTLHFHRSRVRPEELDAVPPEWFHMAHLCDAPREIPATTEELIFAGREARLDPGEGGINLAEIVNRMPEVPYSLGIPNLERVQKIGYAEHARLCLSHAREYLAAHPRELCVPVIHY